MGEDRTKPPEGYQVIKDHSRLRIGHFFWDVVGPYKLLSSEAAALDACWAHHDSVCSGEYEMGLEDGRLASPDPKTKLHWIEEGATEERRRWEARAMELATWSDCKPYPWAEGWHPRQVLRFLVADMIDRRENAEAAIAEHDREQQAKALEEAAEDLRLRAVAESMSAERAEVWFEAAERVDGLAKKVRGDV